MDYELKDGRRLALRQVRGTDAAELLRFLNRVGGESDYLLFEENGMTLTEEQERQFIHRFHENERSKMLIGTIDGAVAVVGTLAAASYPRQGHVAELSLCVGKEYWRQGVGSATMKELLGFARKTGKLEVVTLTVFACNTHAVSLYKKFGFQEYGHFQKYAYVNGAYYDARLMSLYL